MRYFFLPVFVLFFCVQIAWAQVSSNSFTIGVLVGSDDTPPTTPVLLTADSLSTTEISVTWSAATDNFSVSGYSVSRDGTPIATTTLLSYIDTGLTASTTYSYTVRAFDAALNYSSSSNSLSAITDSTPSITPPTPTEGGSSSGGTASRVVMQNLVIEEDFLTTNLNFNTARPARIEVRWGRTDDYELGYILSDDLVREHSVLLTDLEPGTTYEYEIIGYTPQGNATLLETGSFTTLTQTPVVNPANVNRFQALENNGNVDLSWRLPNEDSVAYVRIVRSHLGFPEHPQAGAIVYQGKDESVTDVDVLNVYSPVYYTAFVYDQAGNVSSGAVAMVYATSPVVEPGTDFAKPIKPIIETPPVITEATSSIDKARVTVEMKMPQSTEIEVTQKNRVYSLADSNIQLDKADSFMVSIPRSAVSGNLKSIIVTILDPTDNRNIDSYLLRINQDRTAYEARVSPYNVSGQSQIKIEIYDYEAFVVATYQAPIAFKDFSVVVKEEEIVSKNIFAQYLWLVISGLFIIILILIIWLILLRRRDKQDS